MSAVNAYLLAHRPTIDRFDDALWIAPRIKCADGFSLSVQVHPGAYCSPRDGFGPDWTEAEIGFPSEPPPPEIIAYAEEKDRPTDTVYAYVPMSLIDALVAQHGGIASEPKP